MKLKYTKQFIDEFYKEYLERDISFQGLCDEKGLPWSSIQKVLKKYNLKAKKSKYTKELIYKIYNSHLEKQLPISSICKELNVCPRNVSYYMGKYNLTPNKYKDNDIYIHEDYFNVIDTQNKAYILGLIYADGCIQFPKKGNPVLSLTLKSKDKYLLESITNELGKNITIYYNKKHDTNTFQICRPTLVNDLVNLGVTANKSVNGGLKLPPIQSDYIPHFIRGFMDGDGTVSKKGHVCFYSTSYKLLEEFKSIFISLGCSRKVNIHEVKNVKIPYYHLHYAYKDSKNKLYPYLYKDAELYMKRKRERFI